jgi:hypothetical protein
MMQRHHTRKLVALGLIPIIAALAFLLWPSTPAEAQTGKERQS